MAARAGGRSWTATEDVDGDGQTIRAGDGVVLAVSLINRDESVWMLELPVAW